MNISKTLLHVPALSVVVPISKYRAVAMFDFVNKLAWLTYLHVVMKTHTED
jgi:hypothetical protein